MEFDFVFGADDTRDSTLRVGAVGLTYRVFGDDDHGQGRVDLKGGSQPCQSSADDQNVGEAVRDFFGGEVGEVPGNAGRI